MSPRLVLATPDPPGPGAGCQCSHQLSPAPRTAPPARDYPFQPKSKLSLACVSSCKSDRPSSHPSGLQRQKPRLPFISWSPGCPQSPGGPVPCSAWEPLPCRVKIHIPLSFPQPCGTTGALRPTGRGPGQELHPGPGGTPWPLQSHPSLVWGLRTQGWGTAYLGPGSGPPPTGAELTVAGPAALGSGVIAVLGVHGAGGVVVQRLNAAHGANLHARPPTALTACLPLARDPPVRAEQHMVSPWRISLAEALVDRGKTACSSRHSSTYCQEGALQASWAPA